jgi:hypothetical protein
MHDLRADGSRADDQGWCRPRCGESGAPAQQQQNEVSAAEIDECRESERRGDRDRMPDPDHRHGSQHHHRGERRDSECAQGRVDGGISQMVVGVPPRIQRPEGGDREQAKQQAMRAAVRRRPDERRCDQTEENHRAIHQEANLRPAATSYLGGQRERGPLGERWRLRERGRRGLLDPRRESAQLRDQRRGLRRLTGGARRGRHRQLAPPSRRARDGCDLPGRPWRSAYPPKLPTRRVSGPSPA